MITMLEDLAEIVLECEKYEQKDDHNWLKRLMRIREFVATYHVTIVHNAEDSKRLKALEQAMGECNLWKVEAVHARADEIMRGDQPE